MIPTIAVIPTRYEPERVLRLVEVIRPDVAEIVLLDNGHRAPLPGSIDSRGIGLYRMWNMGTDIARSRSAAVNVAILNDDIRILPGTLLVMAKALRAEPRIACVYPDARIALSRGLPEKTRYTVSEDPAAGREMTGFCFMFKGELPLPPFDEGYAWWYGDSQFDETVKLAGYGVARIDWLPIEHKSDAEANDWARRPELKAAVERDGVRWAELHRELRNGRWWPISEGA